jgi:hypothetical protein
LFWVLFVIYFHGLDFDWEFDGGFAHDASLVVHQFNSLGVESWYSVFNFSKSIAEWDSDAWDYQVFSVLSLDQNLLVRSWSLSNFAQIHFYLELFQIHFIFWKLHIFL